MKDRKTPAGFVLTIDSDDDDDITKETINEKSNGEKIVPTEIEGGGRFVWKSSHGTNNDTKNNGTTEKPKPNELSSSFIFDNYESDEEKTHDGTVTESWDFTKTIERLRSKEHPAQKATTSLNAKIKIALEKRGSRNQQSANEISDSDAESSEMDSDDEAEVKTQRKTLRVESDNANSKIDESSLFEIQDLSNEIGTNSATLQKQKNVLEAQQASQPKHIIDSFAQLNLSRALMRATQKLGFDTPTPIQAKAIPFALSGRDICGSAVTGSGKTAAYLLPILERLIYRPKRLAATRVLIVTPTRELAQQVLSMMEKLAQFTDIKGIAIVGGLNSREQGNELRARPDVVVATPGRLIDHVRNTASVDLDNVEILVLDEADRLLELGFQDEVMELVKFCPRGRQTMLFSATMTTSVNQLIELSLNRPVRIEADPLYDMANRLTQEFVRIRPNRENDREAMLLSLVSRSFKTKTIVFFKKKWETHRMGILFGLCGLNAAELHGNLPQTLRLESLQKFRDGSVDYLLCTDLASRGIDIVGVENVINFEMPRDLATYVHRVGRTARAGRGGHAVTLVSESQRMLTKEVLKRSKHNVKSRTISDKVITLFRDKIDDFAPEVKDVLEQEKLEKEIRVAEMEANRASNIIDHRDEIMSRPARTWFQSSREKQAVKDAALELVKPSKKEKESKNPEDKKQHRLSRKKRRRLEAEKADTHYRKEREAELREKAADRGEELDAETLRHVQRPSSTKALLQQKAAKRKMRTAKDADDNAPSKGSQSIHDYEDDFENEEPRKKKGKKNGVPMVPELETSTKSRRVRFGGQEMAGFESEMTPGTAKSFLDARHKGKKGENEFVFKEHDLSKGGLKKGAKKGHKTFKSKARYKRR